MLESERRIFHPSWSQPFKLAPAKMSRLQLSNTATSLFININLCYLILLCPDEPHPQQAVEGQQGQQQGLSAHSHYNSTADLQMKNPFNTRLKLFFVSDRQLG